MTILIISFFVAFFTTLLLIRSKHLHDHLSGDHHFSGPQKIHTHSVPRIGGLSIATGLIAGTLFIAFKDHLFSLIAAILVSCIPVFGIGLTEDLKKNMGFKSD